MTGTKQFLKCQTGLKNKDPVKMIQKESLIVYWIMNNNKSLMSIRHFRSEYSKKATGH